LGDSLARSRPPSAPLAFRRGTSRVETAAVVDLVDESRKVVGDIGEGSVGHRIDGLDLERLHEALGLGVVVRFPSPPHRAEETVAKQGFNCLAMRKLVLTALIHEWIDGQRLVIVHCK
jgi:hypothetical protein